MIRDLKILGLALVAMLALGSMAASAASAHTSGEYTSNSVTGKTWITGTNANHGTHTVSSGGLTTHCTTADLTGTVAGNAVTSITVTVTYDGCTVTVLGFSLSTTVNMGNCAYKFTEPKTGTPGTGGTTVDIVDHGGDCEANPIRHHVSNFAGTCNVVVKEQSELHHVVFDGTSPATHDITMTGTISGIHVQHTGGLCPEGTKTYTNASTSGNFTIQGWEDSGGALSETTPVDVWVDHTEA